MVDTLGKRPMAPLCRDGFVGVRTTRRLIPKPAKDECEPDLDRIVEATRIESGQ